MGLHDGLTTMKAAGLTAGPVKPCWLGARLTVSVRHPFSVAL